MRIRRPNLRFTIYDLRFPRNGRGLPGVIPSPVTRHPSPQAGVALIITIIMISVITFLTIAFLALSGREKGAVKVATNQTTARLAAEQALDRAKVELLASLLASQNPNNSELLVSTNFVNWQGFNSTPAGLDDPLTNVNYFYPNGDLVAGNDARQNLVNLLYSPRPPVFVITNRQFSNNVDFRYYLDLNRNGVHDRTGLWPATNQLGQVILQTGTNAGLFQSNYVVGDPEWIGGLNRAGIPHGAENRFVNRSAYVAVPTGRALDVNYTHNNAKTDVNVNGFFRNQGVGGWELNLAGFFRDLNTNEWSYLLYSTNTYPGSLSTGTAFDDAYSIWRWRMGTFGQNSVANLFLGAGQAAFNFDLTDGYTAGPLQTSTFGYLTDPDFANATTTRAWPGADTENHYFSPQDFFDPTKTSTFFVNRLSYASTNVSTYDRYTYYRLLSQLSTDSAPEDPDKLHLNYVNVDGLAATNFVPWTANDALSFFTNAADRMLRAYSEEWLAADYTVYTNRFRSDELISITNIPVVVSNQFVYSPALHRILQVAANIWDTKPNGRATAGLPSVFQPLFAERNGNVYIRNFRGISNITDVANVPVDILATGDPVSFIQTNPPNVLVYGVPPVLGVVKGLPNFNEFQIEPVVSMTRKVQLRREAGVLTETNQFFTMSVTMPQAVEFWNSYATNYPFPVSIRVTNFTTMTMTNDLGVNFSRIFTTGQLIPTLNNWPRYVTDRTNSFIVTVRTNLPLLPTIGYLPGPDRNGTVGFISATNESAFDVSQNLIMPRWGITISNRVQAAITRQDGRIIDYVLLGNMIYSTNLTDIISDPSSGSGNAFDQLWATNTSLVNPNLLSGRLGVIQQINISLGTEGIPPAGEWTSYGTFLPSTAQNEITKFRNLYFNTATNGPLNVPFSPTYQFRVPMIWQANDPLVHYMSSDLFYLDKSTIPVKIKPVNANVTGLLDNIGKLNERYKPWSTELPEAILSTDPDAHNTGLKDPLVTSSDAWQFPTNMLPTVGWLGRIHRGTPWQTIYLKSLDIGLTNYVASPTVWARNAAFTPSARKWASWSGNPTLEEGFYNRPVADRLLFDVFTTAVNDNASRGRLPINQTGLASWSALFSGMVVLTNDGPDRLGAKPLYRPYVIEPAGIYNATDATLWPPLVRLVEAINTTRANRNLFPSGTFNKLGDILAVPELTVASPFLNVTGNYIPIRAITDAAYEWIPQQMMSLVQLGEPRFVIYAYGQSLQPAPDSILVGGTYSGLCTNYAITAEVALRAVVRVEGSLNPNDTSATLPRAKRYPPYVVTESYNFLPPD